MHHFFVEPGQMEGEQVRITGPDVNHMKNALRMKAGEQFLVSDGQGGDYLCRLEELDAGRALGRILEKTGVCRAAFFHLAVSGSAQKR